MKKTNKKSQGLPINVIIIAAIGLSVLFVIIYLFSIQTGKTVSTLESCVSLGGKCAPDGKDCLAGEAEKINSKCGKSTQKCCIKIFEDIK